MLNKCFPFFLFFIFLLPIESHAHSRSESYSYWRIGEEGVSLTYTLRLKTISTLSKAFQGNKAGWQQRVGDHIVKNIELNSVAGQCSPKGKPELNRGKSFLKIELLYRCEVYESLGLINNSIFDLDIQHIHIVRVKDNRTDEGNSFEKVMLSRDRALALTGEEYSLDTSSTYKTVLSYGGLGMEHIISGWDHLAFLFSLLLLIYVFSQKAQDRTEDGQKRVTFLAASAWTVTGFTLGHSISLIGLSLGYVETNSALVESLIAVSIFLVCIEIVAIRIQNYAMLLIIAAALLLIYVLFTDLLARSAFNLKSIAGLYLFSFCYLLLSRDFLHRTFAPIVLLASLFGLIHGFGFAGSLQEIGLPEDRLVSALISFNLGVEIGQILIVLIILTLLTLLVKVIPKVAAPINQELIVGVLSAVAIYWFVERSIV